MNQQTIQGNWTEIKGRLRERWGQLTDQDLDQFQGNVEQLVGAIQQSTGEARENVEDYIEDITAGAGRAFERGRQSAEEYARRMGEQMQHSYEDVAERFRYGYSQAENMVRSRPTESLGVAFCAGLIAGALVGLAFASRR